MDLLTDVLWRQDEDLGANRHVFSPGATRPGCPLATPRSRSSIPAGEAAGGARAFASGCPRGPCPSYCFGPCPCTCHCAELRGEKEGEEEGEQGAVDGETGEVLPSEEQGGGTGSLPPKSPRRAPSSSSSSLYQAQCLQLLEELLPFVGGDAGDAGGADSPMTSANAMAPTRDSSRYQHQLHHQHQHHQQQHQQQQQQGVTPFQVACPISEHMLARDLEQGWQEILEMSEMQVLDMTAPPQHHQQHHHQQHQQQHQQQQQQAAPGPGDASMYSESPELLGDFCHQQQRLRVSNQSFYPGTGGTVAGTGGSGGGCASSNSGFCATFPGVLAHGFPTSAPSAASSGGSYQPMAVEAPPPTASSFRGFAACGDGAGPPCARRCLSPDAAMFTESAAALLPYGGHLGYASGSSSASSSSCSGRETFESFGTLGYGAGAEVECPGEEPMPCEMMFLDHQQHQQQQHEVHSGKSGTTSDYSSFLGASALVDLSGSGGTCAASGITRDAGPVGAGPDCLHLESPPPPPRRVSGGGPLHLLPAGADTRPSRDERRAAAMRIPIGVQQIVNMAVDDFNELLARHRLSEPQLALVRDIRRRGKNKVAAQNCRRRKLDGLTGLERELGRLQGRREALLAERRDIEEGVRAAERRLAALRAQVFAALRDDCGRPYSPERFCLRHTSDGAVCLVPSGEGGGDEVASVR